MITGAKEYLDDLAKTYVCKDDGGALVIVWHAGENSLVLRCGNNHFPEEITRQHSLTELRKQGVELPEPIKSNVEKGIRRRAMQQGNQSTAMTFQGVPTTDLATGELLSLETVKALVAYAQKYQLDPARGHVVLMYSKPYITLDGYLYHANRSGIAYSLRARPMTSLEVTEYKIQPADFGWISELEFTETKAKFIGTGIVTYDEMTAKSTKHPEQLRSPVVAKHPWQLAQKRAEWQALRRAFPIGETGEGKNEA